MVAGSKHQSQPSIRLPDLTFEIRVCGLFLSQQLRKHFVRKHPTARSQTETVRCQLDQSSIVEMSNLETIPFTKFDTKPASKLGQLYAISESQAKKQGLFFTLNVA